jgi:dynein heavy chain
LYLEDSVRLNVCCLYVQILRVFHDRLICPEDKALVQGKLADIIQRRYPQAAEPVLADPIIFGDYQAAFAESEPSSPTVDGKQQDQHQQPSPRLYEDLGDYSNIKDLFEKFLGLYNMRHKPMQLVFFEDALEHLTRIHRTMRLPRGNCLLVGVGGSGKQSLARLAAYTAGCEVFEITLTRGYDEAAFREDLKVLYGKLGGTGASEADGSQKAGGKKVVFLFTDAHVADEGFLESINNMLTSGKP